MNGLPGHPGQTGGSFRAADVRSGAGQADVPPRRFTTPEVEGGIKQATAPAKWKLLVRARNRLSPMIFRMQTRTPAGSRKTMVAGPERQGVPVPAMLTVMLVRCGGNAESRT
jgi:hypothetical protein